MDGVAIVVGVTVVDEDRAVGVFVSERRETTPAPMPRATITAAVAQDHPRLG